MALMIPYQARYGTKINLNLFFCECKFVDKFTYFVKII